MGNNTRDNVMEEGTKKERTHCSSLFVYPKPGSNRYGPFGPQDFKSGVSTYSTIRAPYAPHKEPTKVVNKFESRKSFLPTAIRGYKKWAEGNHKNPSARHA